MLVAPFPHIYLHLPVVTTKNVSGRSQIFPGGQNLPNHLRVTLDKLLKLFEPWSPHLWPGDDNKHISLIGITYPYPYCVD